MVRPEAGPIELTGHLEGHGRMGFSFPLRERPVCADGIHVFWYVTEHDFRHCFFLEACYG